MRAVLLREGDVCDFAAHHGRSRFPRPSTNGRSAAIRPGAPSSIASLCMCTTSRRRRISGRGRAVRRRRPVAQRKLWRGGPLWRASDARGRARRRDRPRRAEASPFSDAQIALLETFADQAVIAIENARLFDEVQARTRDLTEALQQQTATADVLKAISRTAFDLDTVLETLVSTAVRLCNATRGGQIFRRHGDVYRYAASQMDVDPAYLRHEQTTEIRPGRGTLIGRVALENRVVAYRRRLGRPGICGKGRGSRRQRESHARRTAIAER